VRCALLVALVVLVVLCSALALLVAQVLADHHDPPVATDHLALLAHRLDAGLDLHGVLRDMLVGGRRATSLLRGFGLVVTCSGRRSDPG